MFIYKKNNKKKNNKIYKRMQNNIQSNIPQNQFTDNNYLHQLRMLDRQRYYNDDDSDITSISQYERILTRDITLTISSLDRDWYNSTLETPFNFNVKLNNGLQNNFMMINYEPKDIVSINLEKVLLNGTNTNISYTSNSTIDITHNPYLYVNAEEIDTVTYGTNKNFDKCLGMIIPSTAITTTDSNYPYIEYNNILNQSKEYRNNPLSSLSKLNINILNHVGSTPTIYNDVLTIGNITYNPAVSSNVATEYLAIKTSDYFPISQYNIGDRIQIKNYIQENTGSIFVGDFESFINRTEGHQIIGVSTTDNDKLLKNRIHIPAPISISQSTGNVTTDEWYSSVKTMGNLRDSSSINSFSDTSGKLINTNLQTMMVIKIKSIEKEANFMY